MCILSISRGDNMLTRRAFIESGTAAALATRLFAAPEGSTKPNPELENLGAAALREAKKLKASYADIRIIRYRQQFLTVRLNPERGTGKTLEVPVVSDGGSFGFGVRVIVDGAWGFAASPLVTQEEIARMVGEAVAVARANVVIRSKPVELAPVPIYRERWQTPHERDPFAVPLEEKLELIRTAAAEVKKEKGVFSANCNLSFRSEDKYFASSVGSSIQQLNLQTYGGVNATATDFKRGLPVDALYQALGDHVGHAHPHRAVVGVLAQVAHEDPLELRRIGPGIVLALYSPVGHLGIHARARDILADLVHDQDVQIHRYGGHPGLDQRQVLLLARLHDFHRHGVELGGVMVRILEDRQTAQDLTRFQNLPAHAADDVLQAKTVGIHVIALRAREFPQTDGHHFEQAAFDLAGEIRVPLDAAYQHHAIGIVRRLVHEGFDAFGGFAQGHHFQLADDGAAHGGFADSVAGQHLGLAGRIGRAVAAHGREDQRPHALLFPILNHVVDDGGDVVDTAAAHADGDARTGLQAAAETAGGELRAHTGGDIGDLAIGKLLANYEKAGKLHDWFILA